ncbi:MAG: glycosyltransferase family 39 protein, partial [Planctomycetota bacterium]
MWAAALVLIALAWRGPWLLRAHRTLDADEAVTGIMAMDVLGGALPLYYYGQGYLGTLEPLVAAPLFALLGRSPAVLRLAPLLLFAVSLVIQYAVVRRWFGKPAARWSVLFWCAVPAPVALWTVKARGGFTAVMLFGMALTWIYQRAGVAAPARRPRWLLAFGIVLGLAWWTNAMVVYYAIPLAVLTCRRILAAQRVAKVGVREQATTHGSLTRRSQITTGRWLAGVVPLILGLVVGLTPVIIYRLSSAALPSRQLLDLTPTAWLGSLRRLVTEVLPLLLDVGSSALGPAAAVVLLIVAGAAWRSALKARPLHLPSEPDAQASPTVSSDGRTFVALLWVTVPLAAVVSNQLVDVHGYRYLLPLFSAVSISFGVLCATVNRRRPLRCAAALVAAAIWLTHCPGSVVAHRNDALEPLPTERIARAAADANITAVAAPYWQCYRLVFLTGRQLACVPIDGPIR